MATSFAPHVFEEWRATRRRYASAIEGIIMVYTRFAERAKSVRYGWCAWLARLVGLGLEVCIIVGFHLMASYSPRLQYTLSWKYNIIVKQCGSHNITDKFKPLHVLKPSIIHLYNSYILYGLSIYYSEFEQSQSWAKTVM